MGDIAAEFTRRCKELPDFRLVNPDDYDIIPKSSYIEKQIAAKEEAKKNLERTREMAKKQYDTQIDALDEEIKKLRKQLK